MSASGDDERSDRAGGYAPKPGQELAVLAEALYLINLLLVPGIAFVILVIVYWRNIARAPALAACHLRQTVVATLWAGVILIVVNGLILALGGYRAGSTWVIVIVYFTIGHATFVMLGVLGLARAMAGQKFVYPLVGRPCPG